MKGYPSIETRGLKSYLESLGLSYEEFKAIMENPLIIAKAATVVRWSGYSRITAVKWIHVYKKEQKQGNKNEKEIETETQDQIL